MSEQGAVPLTYKPKPNPCFLDECEPLGHIDGDTRWRSTDRKRLFTWDGLHGEIEVFNKRGKHMGAIDAVSGAKIKEADPGRTISV